MSLGAETPKNTWKGGGGVSGPCTHKSLMCSMSVQYIIQDTNHQQVHKECFIINRNKLLHVSTLLGHLQGELFIVTLRLHFIVE
jgi:hypothetical protein